MFSFLWYSIKITKALIFLKGTLSSFCGSNFTCSVNTYDFNPAVLIYALVTRAKHLLNHLSQWVILPEIQIVELLLRCRPWFQWEYLLSLVSACARALGQGVILLLSLF